MRNKQYLLHVVAAALFGAAFLCSCASSPSKAGSAPKPPAAANPSAQASASFGGSLASGPFPAEAELSPFARRGLASLSTFELSNGIPVVVRKNSASPVRHISLVIRGGSAASSLETAGYELLALKTMARGSASHSYEEIQNLLDETSASMGASANMDYSAYSLTALDKYFSRLLPLWADTLVSPSFNQADFDQVLSEAKLALASKEKDPWQRTALSMNKAFFEGHPYAAAPEGSDESLASASLDKIKAWYAASFSADRLFVVASGDFDAASLKAELEKAIGSIPDRHAGLPAPAPRFGGSGAGSLVKIEHPQSRGLAYIRGDFAAPSPADGDYMAAGVAMKMFSDLLFNVVRDEHGAAYTPSSYIRSSVANYGSIVIYKTSMTNAVKRYIDAAADEFKAGKCLASEPSDKGGAAPRTSIEEALPIYKAQFANEYYEKLQTNAAVAGLIAQSVVTTGDCRTWLLDGANIEAVSADAVKAAAAKYLFGQKITWVVLGSADTLVPVVSSDYEKLGSK
jgi:zinc protease